MNQKNIVKKPIFSCTFVNNEHWTVWTDIVVDVDMDEQQIVLIPTDEQTLSRIERV